MKILKTASLLLAGACALPGLLRAQIFNPPAYTLPQAQDSVWDAPSQPDASVRENDAGRWALPLNEVMQRTYDISGQKSEWVLGTSILGNPELDPRSVGIGSVSRRYPAKLAGLYASRLGFDGSTLTLNGDNGILFEERHGLPIDTPITDLAWERGAFTGNALHLDFRRLITDSISLDLGIQSRSNKLSKEYSYQNVTHSPYFALGRDSSDIPFGGRNIAMNSMHIQPMLTTRFGFGKAFLKMNFLSLDNADNTNHKVLLDSLDKAVRTFQAPPYTISESVVTYGAGIELYPFRKLAFSTDIHYGTHEIEEDSLARIFKEMKIWTDTLGNLREDSLFYDTTRNYTYETVLGDFGLRYRGLLNPSILFQYEFLNADEEREKHHQEYKQDREVGYLQLSDTLAPFMFRFQGGLQRNSSLLDEVEYAPAFSADATVFLPGHLRLNGTFRRDTKFPDISQLKFTETGRLAFPNEELENETRYRGTANLGWYSREVFYGLGLRREIADNLIKPYWVKNRELRSIEEAYRWTNIDEAGSIDWIFSAGFRLGNWKFFLERGEILKRYGNLIDVADRYYKGSIHWQNRFVRDRLGVSVRVDWQWFSDREDCTINEQHMPELEHMKHYLAMDFEARMQILTFELYSRIENFNHSIYMPESGYTPEGLRFAYGIVWTFTN